MLELTNVGDWITVHRDDIGGFSRGNRTEEFGMTDEVSGIHGCCLNCLHRGHSVLDHECELSAYSLRTGGCAIGVGGGIHETPIVDRVWPDKDPEGIGGQGGN